MSEEKPPDWLPDGWIMEVRRGKKGFTYRYYTCPISEYTFCSKEEVIHYLNIVAAASHASEDTECFGDEDQQLVHKVKDSLKWLPRGWIMEIRTRKIGAEAEERYKVLYRIEYSPDGLPDGWIKEIRFRRNKDKKSPTKQDAYYTDPESGYVFRTLKDCICYIEHGVLSKHAFKPNINSVCKILAFEQDFLDLDSDEKLNSTEDICKETPFCSPKFEVTSANKN
ncbi:uncharacterized protein LOC135649144 isoform X2 [Musa acuminata AAA Group]|uniref:uncharacterized protein LOC135593504 isoform X2 n=1 Tax=Musa acuminata AAA Group TaxID=214697 RepID=UPI0031E34137